MIPDLENVYFKFHDFPRICTNPVSAEIKETAA